MILPRVFNIDKKLEYQLTKLNVQSTLFNQ